VTAAIYEAVEAGSAYVAPRRLREIIARWQRDGRPVEAAPAGQAEPARPIDAWLGESADISLPHGFGSRQTWRYTVARIAATLDRGAAEALFAGTALIGYRDGEATIAVATDRQADQLSGPYRAMVERALSESMRRPVRIAVLSPAVLAAPESTERHNENADSTIVESSEEAVEFGIPGTGMTSGQVWQAVLDELTANGDIPAANLGAWVRPARLLAAPEPGMLVVGAPHAPAQRRIAKQFTRPIERALSRVLGRDARIEVVTANTWRGPLGAGFSEAEERAG
jgi:hypothetical protein